MSYAPNRIENEQYDNVKDLDFIKFTHHKLDCSNIKIKFIHSKFLA